jgi:hypothetical protein
MMEVTHSSETLGLTRATRPKISEEAILHSHRLEILKSNIALTGWTLQQRLMFPVRYELGFISQKTTFFIVTAFKTSNLK